MKLVVTAAIVLVTSFALAIGCHHENDASTTPPMAAVGAGIDAGPAAGSGVIDAAGPSGAGNGTTGSMPATNTP
jgi:hypothetical protein